MTTDERLELLEAEIRDLKTSVLLALRATQRLDETLREQTALAETEHEQLRESLAELQAAQEQQPEPARRKRRQKAWQPHGECRGAYVLSVSGTRATMWCAWSSMVPISTS